MKKLSEITDNLLEFDLPIGLVIADTSPNLSIICVNNTFVKMLGFSDMNELITANKGSAWTFVSPLDVERLSFY
ncbi:MAG: hypothetical protein RR902_07555, partial [Oscillospiraceae bacterium]